MTDHTTTRRIPHTTLGVVLYACAILTVLACGGGMVEVEGERSMNSDPDGANPFGSASGCPEASCSDTTPQGLTFVGAGFWDDTSPHLGPIIAGGTFDLGLRRTEGGALPAFTVETSDPSVLTAAVGVGAYQQSGGLSTPVTDHVVLTAHQPGRSHVRVLDSQGALMDRILLNVETIERVEVLNVNDPGRDHLEAGTEELIGVRLIVGGAQRRAIDQEVSLSVEGVVQPENMYWDCFTYQVPLDRDEVTFTARSGDVVEHVTFPIR